MQTGSFPAIELPGLAALRTVDRPAGHRFPARRQMQFVELTSRGSDRLLRLDLFDASGAGGMDAVLRVLRDALHSAEPRQVEPERTQDGALLWSWRGVRLIGAGRWVAQLRNAGTGDLDLDAFVPPVLNALRRAG
ncbi:MAG: hypothetical protein R3E10_11510 [Gemmatimonadota bacterium]